MHRTATIWAALALALALSACSSKLPYEGKSVAELEKMLKDEDPKVQARGAFGAGREPDKARQLVPALRGALASKDALVREYAAQALGQAGPGAAEAVAALTAALSDPEWTVQRQAALALGKIGSRAQSAVPALEKLTNHSSQPLRAAVEQALKQIQSTQGR
jgi:HEAT repeat protein